MTLIIGLLLIAFVLFFFEIFLPGGILAVIGALLLLAACGVTYNEYGIIWAVSVFVCGLLTAFGLFFLELRLIAHTRYGQQLSLKSTIATRLNPRADDAIVGREGVALTTLAPTGKIKVEGKSYVAQAEDGFLEKGHAVKVVRSETFKVIVTRI